MHSLIVRYGKWQYRSEENHEDIEVVLSTSDLIAELERRRPCRKCKGFQTLRCVGCIWASVYKMKIDSDNFEEAI